MSAPTTICIGNNCPSFWTNPSSEGSDPKIIQNINNSISEFRNRESMTFGRPLDEIHMALFETYRACSMADWDGYGAYPVTTDAYEEAMKIIQLLPSEIKMPEIIPEPNGEIGFEWREGKGHVLVISVSGKHRITYASIFGDDKIHGSVYFGEALPYGIIELLRVGRFIHRWNNL